MPASALRSPVLGLVGLLALTGCGGSSTSGASKQGTQQVAVTLTDTNCDVDKKSFPAGPVTFQITGGSSKVTEAEVMQGEKILAEKENIADGLESDFTLDLKAGSYALRCPGGSGPQDQPFTVTAGAVAAPLSDEAEQAAAIKGYEEYVKGEVAQQVTATKVLTDAVRKGDLADATAAYAGSRVNYERIEPVAESFGTIDPDIDARLPDVTGGISAWTGYHRLEYAIFKDKSLAGMTPIANGLDADVARLNTLVQTAVYTVPQIANGASELLDEVSASKITGEEENYSHVDLVDFQGNVDGARKCFELLEPALKTRDAALATRIATAFDAVDAGLKPYRTGTGPTQFKTYDAVAKADTRTLAGLVDALAEPLSKVAAELVKA
jgi:iron uptake system component EfeO